MSNRINFTVKVLEALQPQDKKLTYYDVEVKGLVLFVSIKGTKSFTTIKKMNGKTVYYNIGRYPDLTITQARQQAREALNIIANGVNPNAKDKEALLKGITLGEVLNDYIISRGTNLKPNTTKNYQGTFNGYLKDWANKEIKTINRNLVEERHRKITKHSPTRANTTMRLLRALFNYAMGEYENAQGDPIILHNPIKRLSHIKAWNKEKPRKVVIKPYELKQFWISTNKLPKHELNAKTPNQSETARDFLQLVLLTGLRRREASNLKWANIDFKDSSLTIHNTKNNESHSLPLTTYLIDLLQRRQSQTNSLFVFEGLTPDKPMNDPKKQLAKVRKISGLNFNIHDLRRTFITIAESLDIQDYTLKRLMNHKDKRDVTAGYIVIGVQRLRKPMEKITNYIMEQVK